MRVVIAFQNKAFDNIVNHQYQDKGVVIAFQNKAFDNLCVITFSFSMTLIKSIFINMYKIIIDKRLQI